MSDRVKGLIVVLNNDYRQEDIEIMKELIFQIKGVKSVKESIVNSDDLINDVSNNEDDFCYTSYNDEYGLWFGISEKNIETILTREQYNKNCYKVKGK